MTDRNDSKSNNSFENMNSNQYRKFIDKKVEMTLNRAVKAPHNKQKSYEAHGRKRVAYIRNALNLRHLDGKINDAEY